MSTTQRSIEYFVRYITKNFIFQYATFFLNQVLGLLGKQEASIKTTLKKIPYRPISIISSKLNNRLDGKNFDARLHIANENAGKFMTLLF